ncbi:uncharacterized protein [Dysidea avara]|uniref:uncharacterized protein n=1 Tax=Dysidea avara TaxID=196820 RepID=UPI00331B32C9
MPWWMRKPAEDVAKTLFVSERTVLRYAERFNATGQVEKTVRRNGCCSKLSESDKYLLIDLILSNPGIFLRELQAEFQKVGCHVDVSTICRTVNKIGLSRQKITHIALQRSELLRAQFIAEMYAFDPAMILWIDETGCDRRNALRQYGYGIRGLAPQDHQLQLRGVRYSAIGILSMDGVQDVYITENTVNGDTFLDFLYTQLLPLLMSFDGINHNSVVVLDNASIHHTDAAVNAICGVGALVRFLPPYSPDLNPIECVFGEVKQFLQANNLLLNTSLSIASILLMAFQSVTVDNCRQYIKFSGYV